MSQSRTVSFKFRLGPYDHDMTYFGKMKQTNLRYIIRTKNSRSRSLHYGVLVTSSPFLTCPFCESPLTRSTALNGLLTLMSLFS